MEAESSKAALFFLKSDWPRLVNMCKYMGISPLGTAAYLRFMLRKRLQWDLILLVLLQCLPQMGIAEASGNTPASMEADGKPSDEQTATTSTGTVNSDCSGFQAYSPIPSHGFLTSSSPSSPIHVGGSGSYPFGPFAMPSSNGIAEASVNTPGSMEADGKISDVKEKLTIKRSRGSLGSLSWEE
ncbi:hypothetical protein Patl1_19035 [Pistacia atlantica]|uniref:Uncharacterized protein n=1 Tax=Pistacia atlantica TaxID=434234 RepID=A0ACC1BZ95_9ROSI|nr:hypothetical protein Patl1_19035 [Pistacia atlantica]